MEEGEARTLTLIIPEAQLSQHSKNDWLFAVSVGRSSASTVTRWGCVMLWRCEGQQVLTELSTLS